MSTAELSSAPPAATVLLPASVLPKDWTLQQLQQHLGDIPLERIRLYPPPGMATEQDVLDLDDHQGALCELIDGILVEKTVSWYESLVASWIVHFLQAYLKENKLGMALTADGALQISPNQVRIPDACFISRERVQKVKPQRGTVPPLVPDVAVEVLSRSNTRQEMDRKREEYFAAGVRLVWYIDAEAHSATVFTSPEDSVVIDESGTLDGGDVLPGFALPLAELFARADEQADMLQGEE